VLVGDATQVKDKVEGVADIHTFDIAGAPLSLATLAVTGVSYEYDTSMISDMTATYSLSVQTMQLGDISVSLEKKNDGGEDVFEVSSNLSGMVTFDETIVVRASDLAPISLSSSMQMGPQQSKTDLAFTATSVSGSVKSMESPEPKEVTFDLVDGTIIDGSLEWALCSLPLAVDQTYRFPAVDAQTGTLQNIDVQVLEIVDVETDAGVFTAFKIKVRRSDGEAFVYLSEEKPHMLVKQEVPAQAMTMTLKSYEAKSKL
jgi:hypothetical protein